MAQDLLSAMAVSSTGMRAQSTRLRVVAENIANANTVPDSPNEAPYRRQLVDFDKEEVQAGGTGVEVDRVYDSRGELPQKHQPDHPAAGPDGYVTQPNVDPLLEMTDMREAKRSHQASLRMFDQARSMVRSTISLMR